MNLRRAFLQLRASNLGAHIIRVLDFDVKVRLPHVNFPVYLQFSKNLSELLTRSGGKEGAERGLFRKVCMSTGVSLFWDVGANVGQYTWEFLSLPGRRESVMFEPDPRNAQSLRKTMRHLSSESCRLKQVAVSDTEGSVTFHIDPITGKQGSIVSGTNIAQLMKCQCDDLTIPCTTLDTLVKTEGRAPHVLKVDVEGAEELVIRGAMKTIERHRPILFIEVARANFPHVETFLRLRGYNLLDAVSITVATDTSFNIFAYVPNTHTEIDALITSMASDRVQ